MLALDTSVVVAALVSWHSDHASARSAVNTVLNSPDVVLPSRVLVEAYSVLTRLPAPHRVAPADAIGALASTFELRTSVTDLETASYWRFLQKTADESVSGGAVYDAEIIACAIEAGATVILTLNLKDFERLAADRLRVVDPQSYLSELGGCTA